MIHIINALLVLGNIIFSAVVWGKLPADIPIHYTAQGVPDNFLPKTAANWYVLPIVGVVLTLILYASSRAKIRPERWNIFAKGEFMALPEEAREIFKKRAQIILTDVFYKMAAFINLLFIYVQVTNYMVAVGNLRRPHLYSLFFIMFFMIYVIIEFVVKFMRLRGGMLKLKNVPEE